MSIINFIIVLGFNIWWLRDGLTNYLESYQWKHLGYQCLLFWGFALWGLANLVYDLYMVGLLG